MTENISISTECMNHSTDTDQVENNEHAGISLEEVQKAMQRMKNNKTPGSDELPSKIFKYGGDSMTKWIHRIINVAWKPGILPATLIISDEWGNAIICPVYKRETSRVWKLSRNLPVTTYQIRKNPRAQTS